MKTKKNKKTNQKGNGTCMSTNCDNNMTYNTNPINELSERAPSFTFNSKESLKKFLRGFFKNASQKEMVEHEENKTAEIITNINIHLINDLSGLFENMIIAPEYNHLLKGINQWDVSHVTNMERMFYKCPGFNVPLNNWNVSNVTNMNQMFEGCFDFNQPLNDWNVSNVKTMKKMFKSCINFNQPLHNWNISNVDDMNEMFMYCTRFDQNLSNWDLTSKNQNQLSNMLSYTYTLKTEFYPKINNEDLREIKNDNDKNNYVDIFFYHVHGTNLSSKNVYYPFKANFGSINFYAPQQAYSYVYHLMDSMTDEGKACSLLFGYSSAHHTIKNNQKIFYLPPLLFSVREPEDYASIGNYYRGGALYHIRLMIDKNKKDYVSSQGPPYGSICRIIIKDKIMNNDDLMHKYPDKITYSALFENVKHYCQQKHIDVNKIVVNILSCHVNYAMNNLTHMMPKIMDENNKIANVLTIKKIPKKYRYYLNVITTPRFDTSIDEYMEQIKKNTRTEPNCGLDLLNFLNIVNNETAKNQTVCLSSKGTSIFTLLNYIYRKGNDPHDFEDMDKYNEYMSDTTPDKQNQYFILRMDIPNAFSIILQSLKIDRNISIITKLYKTKYYTNKKGEQHINHIGRYVAFMKQMNNIMYCDMDNKILKKIDIKKGDTEVFNEIKGLYPNFSWEFADLVFKVDVITPKQLSAPYKLYTYDDIDNMVKHGATVIEKTQDVFHGGEKGKGKGKKYTKTNRKYGSKKNIKKIKGKHRITQKKCKHTKKRYQSGGEETNSMINPSDEPDFENDPDFEEYKKLVTEINNQLHIPTALVS